MLLFTGSRASGKWSKTLDAMKMCWERKERTTLMASKFVHFENRDIYTKLSQQVPHTKTFSAKTDWIWYDD